MPRKTIRVQVPLTPELAEVIKDLSAFSSISISGLLAMLIQCHLPALKATRQDLEMQIKSKGIIKGQ